MSPINFAENAVMTTGRVKTLIKKRKGEIKSNKFDE
jgi:hypothetical protein